MKQKIYLWTGITILFLLGISYFITITIESGYNYFIKAPLLGALIFYNPFILGIYVLTATVLIFLSRKQNS